MPKNLFQEIIFSLMMVLVMVYGMVCYNVALATGGMSNQVFLIALKELPIMVPLGFVLEMLIAGPIARKITFRIFNPKEDKSVFIIAMISICTIWVMCPLMSFVATLLFKGGLMQKEFISIWLETTVKNYPMAAGLQFILAGPLVRWIFSLIFRNK